MWSYKQARDYLVNNLLGDATAQERGEFLSVGQGFDELDANLPRDAGPEFDQLHLALSFWDGWIDARNHRWKYYAPIREADWPRLARAVAARLAADLDVDDPLVLQRFGISSAKPVGDCVLLVHGFGGKRIGMWPLCKRLRGRGFRITRWGYVSLVGSIEKHAARLHEHLTATLNQEARIHLVAHSMGAIVVRGALSFGLPANLGRIVLLAPPNQGTPVARRAARIVGRICRPIADLSDQRDSFVKGLPHLQALEIGVVAARFDILVPLANTHLNEEQDHAVVNTTHNLLLLSRTAADLTTSFLSNGRFATP